MSAEPEPSEQRASRLAFKLGGFGYPRPDGRPLVALTLEQAERLAQDIESVIRCRPGRETPAPVEARYHAALRRLANLQGIAHNTAKDTDQ